MSFSGSLESFSFTNILQMIALEKKTGLLQVEHDTTSISIAFRNGEVIFAERRGARDLDRLKYTLVANKLVPKEKIIRALREFKTTMRPIWTILSRYTPTGTLQEMLERQIKDCLFLALQWEVGSYQFDITGDLNVPEAVGVSIGIDFILMEGCRVADEWRVLARTFPTGDALVRRSEGVTRVRTVHEKLIMSYLREEMTVEMLINVSRLGEFETCEAINALLKRGALKISEGKKKPVKAKVLPWPLFKKTAGMAIPVLALLITLTGVFFQLGGLKESLPGTQEKLDIAYEEVCRTDLDRVFSRLQLYTALYGAYPQNLTQLLQTGLLSEADIRDPWGHPIQYFTREGRFFLYSAGRKGDISEPVVAFGEGE